MRAKLGEVFRLRYGNNIISHQYIVNEAVLSEPLYIAGMWRHCNWCGVKKSTFDGCGNEDRYLMEITTKNGAEGN